MRDSEKTDLPVGWVKSPLSTLVSKLVDGSHNPPAKQSTGFPMLSAVNINNNSISYSTYRLITEEAFLQEDRRTRIAAGDVLLTIVGAIGRSAVVSELHEKFTMQRSVAVITPIFINSKFLMYQFESPNTAQYFKDNARGTAQKGIYLNSLGQTEILIPPLPEQKRIVAKIEELLSELDKGIESFKTAREQLKVYRQALLKHAFEGKLTAAWREANNNIGCVGAKQGSSASPAFDLCSKQDQSQNQKTEQKPKSGEADEALASPLQNHNQSKRRKPLSPLAAEELAELPELPDGWGWVKLGTACSESILGKMLDKEKNKGTLKPYLRNINVRWSTFDLHNLLEMRFEDSEEDRYCLADGDLVICEGGEPGRCAVWRNKFGIEIRIQKALHRVRFTSSILPDYVQKYFELYSANNKIEKYFTGTTIKHLTGDGLSKIPLPICSAREQLEIMSILESKLSEIDNLDQTITTALQQSEALRQSILKKAFSGQLVPQDPNDEPAAELLARIKAERADVKPNTKGGRDVSRAPKKSRRTKATS
jgi:type I restriction enzyme, S subunit